MTSSSPIPDAEGSASAALEAPGWQAPTDREVRDGALLTTMLSRAADPDGRGEYERRRQGRPTVSVVIPTLNEEPNLPFVLPRISAWIDEVVIVDGRSTDGTLNVARDLLPEVTIVHQTGVGKGDALRAGFAAARGDLIIMLDADGSTDPREIPAFVGALASGADFVKGTRFAQGAGTADMSFVRMLGNRAFVLLVRLLFGGRFSDMCYGYIAFWKRVLPLLELDSDGFEIETQMNLQALRAGLRVVEVPSYERLRLHGESNLRTFPDGWRVLKTIVRERFRPRRRPSWSIDTALEPSPPLIGVFTSRSSTSP
jgi:glycosyltransferase involved in cell wall biosynthesis